MGNKVNFKIDFTTDKAGLATVKKELEQIQKMTVIDFKNKTGASSLTEAQKQLSQLKNSAKELETAYSKAFNPSLGVLNISKMNNELKKLDINRIYKDFSKLGSAGTNAFRNFTSEILTTNVQLKETNKFIENIGNTIGNTIKWTVSSSAINTMSESIQKAWNYTKALDSSLNDIRIVTNKSSDEMAKFAKQANKAALDLGASTKDYTKASLIYYQQGLDEDDVKARTEATVKAANVTKQSADTVSEQLTAVWNGYKVGAEEAELYVDKLAAVSAKTAADLEELSKGMSKVASAANSAGIDIDKLNGMLATVVSVTREAPETIGSSFKTIFARMGDLALDGQDEYGVTLGKVSGQLQSLGIQILDETGNMRNMGDVIEDMAVKWDTWTRAQKQAAAVAVAGKMQYSRLIALFDNWDMYTDAVQTSVNAMGELQKEQDTYMESTVAHLEKLGAAWERVFSALIDQEGTNGLIDGLTKATEVLANFIEGIGGGKNLLLTLGSVGAQVFSKQIAGSIATTITNFKNAKENAKQLQAELEIVKQLGSLPNDDTARQDILKMKESILELKDVATEADQNLMNGFIERRNQLENESQTWEDTKQKARDYYESLTGENLDFNKIKDIEMEVKENIESGLKEIGPSSKQSSKDLEDFKNNVQSIRKASIDFDEQLDDSTKNIDKYVKELSSAEDTLSQYEAVAENVLDSQSLQSEDLSKLSKAYNDLKEARKNAVGGEDALAIDSKYQQTAENFLNTFTKVKQNAENGAKETLDTISQEVTGKTESIKNSIEGVGNESDKLIEKLKRIETIQGFVNVAAGIGQIASALQMLTNLKDVFNNENLTTGEKILQVTIALTTATTLMVNGLSSMKIGFKGLTTYITKTAIDMGIMTVAEGGATASTLTLNVALKVLSKTLTAVMVKLLPFIAIGAVVVGTVAAIVKAYNADADAAQKANEQVEKLTENYKKLVTESENLKKSISDYSTGLEALKKLQAGTEEYKTKLEETNKKAKELIETYKLFDSSDYSVKNGVIEISDEALKKIQQQADEAVRVSERAMYGAKIYANQANLRYQATRDSRQLGNSGYAMLQAGMTIGKSTLTFGANMLSEKERNNLKDENIKRVNTDDMLKAAEAISKLNFKELPEAELKKAILNSQEVPQTLKDNLDKIFADNSLKNNLLELASATSEAAKANRYYSQQILSSKLVSDSQGVITAASTRYNQSTGKSYIDEELKAQIESTSIKLTEKYADEMSEKLSKVNVDKSETYDWNKTSTEEAAGDAAISTLVPGIGNLISTGRQHARRKENLIELTKQYAKATGVENADELIYSTSWGKGVAKDKKGNKVIEGISPEDMNKEIKLQQQRDAINQEYANKIDAKGYFSAVGEIAKQSEFFGNKFNIGEELRTSILNSLADENNKIDISQIITLDKTKIAELESLKNEDLIKALFGSEENAKKVGIENTQAYIDGFREQLELAKQNYDPEKTINALVEGKAKAEQEDEGLTKKKTAQYADELKGYTKHLMDVEENEIKASEAGDGFADSLSEDAETAVEVAEAIIRMNKGVEALAKNFDDWSDVLKKSEKTSQEYYDALHGLRDATSDLLDLNEDSEKFLSDGFLTSAENLELLEEAANGSGEAIDKLRQSLSEEILLQVVIANSPEDVQGIYNELLPMLQEIQSNLPDFEVGAVLNGEESFLQSCQNLIEAAGMTVEQAQAFFNSMGFEAEFETKPQEVTKTGRNTVTETTVDEVGQATTPDGQGTYTYPKKMSTKTYPGEEYTYTDYVDAFAMSTNGQTPVIKSMKKTASKGSANNYSSSNKGGGSPKKSSGGGKKGGGGGSSKDPDKMDKLEDEANRYHDIDIEIKRIQTDLSRLQSQQDKLFGGDLINNLNEQLRKLDKQIDNYNKKIRIAQGEAAELRNKLSAKGVSFDSEGLISNYMQTYTAQLNYVNSLIEKYNGMSAEAQESYKETVEKAKKDFENFKKDLDRYDTLATDTIPGLQDSIQEAIDKQIEINIKEFDMEIEIRLSMSSAERDWNEFKKKVIDGIKDDDILGNAKAQLEDFYSYYKENQAGAIQATTRQLEGTLEQLYQMDKTGVSKVYGDNRTAALDDLQKYYQQSMQDLEDMEDLIEEIKEAYLSMMDEAEDKMEDQIKMYEQVKDAITHDISLISLVYGEESYEKLSQYYELQEKNNNEQLDFQRRQVDFWQQQLNILDKGSKEWEAAKENWLSAVSEWNDKVEESIENLQQKYENAINSIFKSLNNRVTNGLGLEYLDEQWELINKNADEYLDTLNSMYQIEVLREKYQDALDNTDNLAQQKQLKKIMDDELKALQEQEKLSQYDIDRANLKYQIALKQLALEEAQQNKSTMRLRRDSQGNYSYQYVEDKNAVEDARKELSNLYNQLYNLDANKYKDNLKEVYDIWVEFQEKMKEAAMINDPEKREQREVLLREQYGELINNIIQDNEDIRNNIMQSSLSEIFNLYDLNIENYEHMTEEQRNILDNYLNSQYDTTNSAFNNLFDLYDVAVEAFKVMSEEEQNILTDSFIPQWDSAIQIMIDKIIAEGGFLPTCQDAFSELEEATKTYEDGLKELQDISGQSFDAIANGLDKTIDKTKDLVQSNEELIGKYDKELNAIRNVENELDGLITRYNDAKIAAEKATEAAYKYWMQQNEQAAQKAKAEQNAKASSVTTSNTSNSSSSSSSSSSQSSNPYSGYRLKGETYTVKKGDSLWAIARAKYGNGNLWNEIYNNNRSVIGSNPNLIYPGQLLRLNTGGYTGDWAGNNGKLAILDKKELVLKDADTKNILKTVEIAKDFASIVSQSALFRMNSIGGSKLLDSYSNNGTLEQNVHITATFPGVKESREIEEAMDNLINIASIRANRKNR